MNIKNFTSNSGADLFEQIKKFSECKYYKIVDIIYSCIDFDDLSSEITASIVYQCRH